VSVAWPDPILCASLFPRGSLDRAVAQVVRPFWRQLDDEAADTGAYLWFLRYAKEGEHFKIRLHGPAEHRDRWAALLEQHAEACIRTADGEGPEEARDGGYLPPIDQDEGSSETAGEDAGPRLAWTTYARRSLVMGDHRLLADDTYAALFTRALARGCELLLADWEEGDSESFLRLRQRFFFHRIAGALSMLWPDEEERARYLAYHRDWLIRFATLQSRSGSRAARGILERYRRERERIGGDLPDPGSGGSEDQDPGGRQERWWSSLVELRSYLLRQRCPELGGATDPFAPDLFSPALFRVLHNQANALGLNPTTEGLLFDLLLKRIDAGSGAELLLVPGERELPAVERTFGLDEELGVFDFENRYQWGGLIASTSEEGAEWTKIFQRESEVLSSRIEHSLGLLRQGRLDEGEAELAEVARRLADVAQVDAAVCFILRRFYLGARAYFEYRRQDFEAAETTMSEVTEALASAIDANPAVLPVAAQAADVPLKRIKMARVRHDWPQVAAGFRELLALVEDEQPLCRLKDGTAVFHATIGRSLAPKLSGHAVHGDAVRYLLEPRRRLVWFRREMEMAYAPPGSYVWYSRGG
jgi:hypothetical protein